MWTDIKERTHKAISQIEIEEMENCITWTVASKQKNVKTLNKALNNEWHNRIALHESQGCYLKKSHSYSFLSPIPFLPFLFYISHQLKPYTFSNTPYNLLDNYNFF